MTDTDTISSDPSALREFAREHSPASAPQQEIRDEGPQIQYNDDYEQQPDNSQSLKEPAHELAEKTVRRRQKAMSRAVVTRRLPTYLPKKGSCRAISTRATLREIPPSFSPSEPTSRA